MDKGKLFLKTKAGLEFVKECEQREYVELAISSPEQYVFIPHSKPGSTIQDLHNFANSRINEVNQSKIAKSKKKRISIFKTVSIIAAIATIIGLLLYFLKIFITQSL